MRPVQRKECLGILLTYDIPLTRCQEMQSCRHRARHGGREQRVRPCLHCRGIRELRLCLPRLPRPGDHGCLQQTGKLLVRTTFGARSIPQKCFTRYQGMQSSPCLAVRRSQVGRPCHLCRPCPLTPAAHTQKQAIDSTGGMHAGQGRPPVARPANQQQLHIVVCHPQFHQTRGQVRSPSTRMRFAFHADSQANGGAIPNNSNKKTPTTHPKRTT